MNAKLREAAAVILTRSAGQGLEIFLAERSPELRFFGGYWAFPGGVMDAVDREVASDADDVARRCAVRELAEEVALRLAPQRFEPVCSITTPPFAPVRYATRFFLVQLVDEVPRVLPGELVAGDWARPWEWLERWRRGRTRVVPPALFLLELLAGGDVRAFIEHARRETAALEAGKLHPVRFSPGLFVAPLETATKPPATTTNCVLVGEERIFVVDPGSVSDREQERLQQKLDECVSRGSELAGILLTHHHPDHVGGVAALRARQELPVYAHPETVARLALGGSARHLGDGDELDLGVAPDGSTPWTLRAYHTPGHAPGHLVFRESRYGALVAGDLVSTVSTIVIDPPEGHLATYLASLERMAREEIGTIYPAHGPAHPDGRALLRQYLEHRQAREDKLIAALGQAPVAVSDLVTAVYDDTDVRLHGLAARSLLAGLIKLEEEGRAKRGEGDRWSVG